MDVEYMREPDRYLERRSRDKTNRTRDHTCTSYDCSRRFFHRRCGSEGTFCRTPRRQVRRATWSGPWEEGGQDSPRALGRLRASVLPSGT